MSATQTNDPTSRYLLPPEAYTSQAWFEHEQKELFGKSWLFGGLVTDIPASGDYMTLQAGNEPLVVVRQKDGTLQAFYNICRHRGVVLLEGKGNVSSGISCFYHRWHYNVDGSLRALPQSDQFPEVVANKPAFGLRAASVGEFNGMVFVNADPAPAQSLAQWLDRVPDLWGPWRPTDLFEIPSNEIEVAANWKLFIENHIDGYHLWHLHAETVVGLDHTQQQWTACGRHWMFYEPEAEKGDMPERRRIKLPVIPEVDESRYGSSVFMLFPNIAGAGGVTFFSIFQVVPMAPDRTRVIFRTFVKPIVEQDFIDVPELQDYLMNYSSGSSFGQSGSPDMSFAERMAAASKAGDFATEDKLAVEAIQCALSSRNFEVGPLAKDYEASIEFYHRSCLDMLEPETVALAAE